MSQRPGHGLQLCHAAFSPMEQHDTMHVAALVLTGSCASVTSVAGSLMAQYGREVPLALGWDTRMVQTTSNILHRLSYYVKK